MPGPQQEPTDPHQGLTDEERLHAITAQAEQVRQRKQELDEHEHALREAAAWARRTGLLSRDIQHATGWSHDKLNTVLRRAGIAPGQSAPRKRD